MESFEELTPTEQALLLGFLPILGATETLESAASAAVCTVVCTLCVYAVSRVIAQRLEDTTRWLILLALGFGLGYALASIVAYAIPVTESAGVYLAVIGVTPLVYAGAGTLYAPRSLGCLIVRFVAVLLAFGIAREVLGAGSLLGRPLPVLETGPIGVLSSNEGSLLLFAAVVSVSCVLRIRRARKAEATQ